MSRDQRENLQIIDNTFHSMLFYFKNNFIDYSYRYVIFEIGSISIRIALPCPYMGHFQKISPFLSNYVKKLFWYESINFSCL